MAVKEVTPVKGEVNQITKFAFTAATTTSDGFVFKMPKMTEEYVVIVVQNSGSSAAKLTLKKPETGSYAASGSDEELQLAGGEFAQVRIESARFANNDGTVTLTGSTADIKIAVLY